MFRVLEGECVVIVHHDGDFWPGSPDVEHGPVHDLGEGFLRVVGESRADGVWVGASAEEPALAPAEGGEVAAGGELLGDPLLPEEVGREGGEVEGLEGEDDLNRELGLSSKSVSTSAIVRSVTEFLAHETVSVMPIVERFRDCFISFKVTGPTEIGPADSSNRSVRIT